MTPRCLSPALRKPCQARSLGSFNLALISVDSHNEIEFISLSDIADPIAASHLVMGFPHLLGITFVL